MAVSSAQRDATMDSLLRPLIHIMKRNFDTLILNIEGVPFEDNASLKTVSFLALTAVIPADEDSLVDAKLRLYGLIQKIYTGGVIDVSAEDIALLKTRIGAVFTNVIVVGRAFDLLEMAECGT